VILIVIYGVELSIGPPVEQVKIDVKNQGERWQDSHKQKMSEIRKGTDALGPKLDQMIEMVSQIIKD
jgi:hypothetical protein